MYTPIWGQHLWVYQGTGRAGEKQPKKIDTCSQSFSLSPLCTPSYSHVVYILPLSLFCSCLVENLKTHRSFYLPCISLYLSLAPGLLNISFYQGTPRKFCFLYSAGWMYGRLTISSRNSSIFHLRLSFLSVAVFILEQCKRRRIVVHTYMVFMPPNQDLRLSHKVPSLKPISQLSLSPSPSLTLISVYSLYSMYNCIRRDFATTIKRRYATVCLFIFLLFCFYFQHWLDLAKTAIKQVKGSSHFLYLTYKSMY